MDKTRRSWKIFAVVLIAVLIGVGVAYYYFILRKPASKKIVEAPYELAKKQKLAGVSQPADLAIAHGRVFVLDTLNDRVLEIDKTGKTIRKIDAASDPRISLHNPMGIASFGKNLYIADTLGHQVVIVTIDGLFQQAIQMSKNPGDAKEPRPIGIAVNKEGEFIVADADNHRVIMFNASGEEAKAIGTGRKERGNKGFNTPCGVAYGSDGSFYVVDIMNSRVQEFNRDGKFVRRVDNTKEIHLGRPKYVAVNSEGSILVSDGLLGIIHMFDKKGKYKGVVGRKRDTKKAVTIFEVPAGLKLDGSRLYVIDRFAGLYIFKKT